MPILLGTGNTSPIYLGSDEVVKVYLGTDVVYDTEDPPTPTGSTGYTAFLSSGDLVLPEGVTSLEWVIVGGGGAGGCFNQNYGGPCDTNAGGGGGGGVLSGVTTNPAAGTYPVVVGAGGTTGDTKGGDSSWSGLTAYGGGRGAHAAGETVGHDGGSGGAGATYQTNTLCQVRNAYSAGTPVAGQGYQGCGNNQGGGAGGCDGTGLVSDISGVAVSYGRGKAFTTNSPPNGAGKAGTPNTGMAGEAAKSWGFNNVDGGAGGSGIVLFRWS